MPDSGPRPGGRSPTLRQGLASDPLVSGLVHDLGNLLLGVDWSVATLERGLGGAEPASREAAEVRRLVERARGLLRFFRDLHGGEERPPSRVEFGTLVSDGAGMLRNVVGEGMGLEFSIAPDAGAAWLDAGRAGRILLSLLEAGRELLPAGGGLALEIAGPAVPRGARATGGPWLRLRLRARPLPGVPGPDAGSPAAPRGPQGLEALGSLAEEAGGRLLPPQRAGDEVVLEVWVPRAAEPAEERGAPAEPEAPAAPGPTILLVDDERAVRKLVARGLKAAGYRLLEAGRGDEALALALARGGAIDLLVTDVTLPGLGGGELASRLAAFVPRLAVLFISGYADEQRAGLSSVPAGAQYLAKPFSPAELVAKVRQMLAG